MLLPALVGTLLSSHAIAQQDSAVPVDWRGITFAEPRDRLPNFSFAGAYASEQGLPSPLEQADITLQSTNSSHDRYVSDSSVFGAQRKPERG